MTVKSSWAAGDVLAAADLTDTLADKNNNKNLLYNGACQIAQRNTSVASITGSGYFTADRWYMNSTNNVGTWTQSVESDAPTGSGLRKSVKMLCTTAAASPAAGANLAFWQRLEGQDVQRIAKGTSSAQQVTLSFWVKSNVTGTYVAWLFDVDNTRSVAATYTVSASGTWEKKSITFPADTTGAFDNDNAGSLDVRFQLVAGSNFTSGTLQTSWGSYSDATSAAGQTNVAAATNNYWQVTGTQLEIGPVATSFEFKSYGQELRECQRYYYRAVPGGLTKMFGVGQCSGTTGGFALVPFPVPMRTTITAIEVTSTASDYCVFRANTALENLNAVPTINTGTNINAAITFTVAANLVAGNATALMANNATAYIGFSAEL